jgi:hypothetical protein
MAQRNLPAWAAIGGITGTVAVVVAPGFVVYSVNQNTDALRGGNENLIFETHLELANQIVADATLATIVDKLRRSEASSEVQRIRCETYQLDLLDIRALAYLRHQTDLLADRHWHAWDDDFSHIFAEGDRRVSRARRAELEYGSDAGFWRHVRNRGFGGT